MYFRAPAHIRTHTHTQTHTLHRDDCKLAHQVHTTPQLLHVLTAVRIALLRRLRAGDEDHFRSPLPESSLKGDPERVAVERPQQVGQLAPLGTEVVEQSHLVGVVPIEPLCAAISPPDLIRPVLRLRLSEGRTGLPGAGGPMVPNDLGGDPPGDFLVGKPLLCVAESLVGTARVDDGPHTFASLEGLPDDDEIGTLTRRGSLAILMPRARALTIGFFRRVNARLLAVRDSFSDRTSPSLKMHACIVQSSLGGAKRNSFGKVNVSLEVLPPSGWSELLSPADVGDLTVLDRSILAQVYVRCAV